VLERFGAAIVLHDLVLMPLYSLIDRLTIGALHRQISTRGTARRPVIGPAPYLRVPAIVSGVMLAIFAPVIFGLGARAEEVASGIPERAYLARWLLLTGVIFAISGAAYARAVARARRRARPAAPRRPRPPSGPRAPGPPPDPRPPWTR
jgi:hypothetical protein